jgi:RHS repeat-associated protein
LDSSVSGGTIQLSATVNQPLSYTGEAVYLVEDGSDRLLGSCNYGTSCTDSTVPEVASATVTYEAEIAPDGLSSAPSAGSVVASDSATAPGWTVTANATVGSYGADGPGDGITVDSSTNYSLTNSGLWLYVIEVSDGRSLVYCIAGTGCDDDLTVPHAAGSTARYVVEVATSGDETTTPSPASAVVGSSPVMSVPGWSIVLTTYNSGGKQYVSATADYSVTAGSDYVILWDATVGGGYYCYGATCISQVWNPGDTYVAYVTPTSSSISGALAESNLIADPGYNPPFHSDGGGNPSSNENRCSCADPVDPQTGEFYQSTTDLALASAGPSLAVTRTYSSDESSLYGPFGYGWSSTLNMALSGTSGPATTVTVDQENGAQSVFTLSGSSYTTSSTDFATLVHNGDGTWTFTRRGTQIFMFNSAGQLLSMSDPNGETVTTSYDGLGRISGLQYGDRTLTVSYGNNGMISGIGDGAGGAMSYGYNDSGELTSFTDATGAVTTYAYDGLGELSTITKPDGGVTTNTYDQDGRVSDQSGPLGDTTFDYSTPGVTTVTSPAGNVSRFVYSNGQMASHTEGYGTGSAATWTYTYDPATGSVASVTDPRSKTTTYTYDSAGNTTSQDNPAGDDWSWTYNSFDEPLTVTDPDSVTVTSTYNSRGDLTGTSTPIDGTRAAVVGYAYTDSAHPGLVTSMTDANAHTTTYGYDADGDLTGVTDPDGDETTYAYDGEGWRVSSTSARGNASGDPADYGTTTTYDGDGRPLTVTTPGGHTTTDTYDGDGDLLTVTDPKSNVTHNTYNTADELTVVTRPDTSTIHYGYDADGNRTSETDPGGHVTTYGYDALDRLISQTTPATTADPSGITTTYTLDGDGNQTAVAQPGAGGATATTTNGYDADNRLTSIAYSDGTTHGVTYTYTPEGERATMVDSTGTSHYTYDLAGWLTSTTDGTGHTVGYTYDPAGNETAIAYPNGHSVTQGFNAEEELSSATDWNSKTTSFGYDRDGDLATVGYPNGVTETTTYDKADVSSALTDTTSTTTLASSTLTRDADDDLTGVTTSGTSIGPSTIYGYNPLGQLTTYTVGSGSPTHYSYDGDDNLTTSPTGTAQTFDAAHEMTHTGTSTVTDDTRGNLVSQVPTSGSGAYVAYDQANRMTGFYLAGNFTSYVYNGDGLRTSKTTGASTSTFTWDTTAGIPLLLSDGSTSYLYGPGDLPIEQINTAGTTTYLLHDQQGSTTLLTDGSGAVVGTYNYIPFGATPTHTGTANTQLRYDGQYQDNESGLYYLRARYYNPTTGQFITRDPLEGQTSQPYEYAADDPIRLADPTGLGVGSLLHKVAGVAGDVALGAGAVAIGSVLVLSAPVSVPVALGVAIGGSAAAATSLAALGTEAVSDCANAFIGAGDRDCVVDVASGAASEFGGQLIDVTARNVEEAGYLGAQALDSAFRGARDIAGRDGDDACVTSFQHNLAP